MQMFDLNIYMTCTLDYKWLLLHIRPTYGLHPGRLHFHYASFTFEAGRGTERERFRTDETLECIRNKKVNKNLKRQKAMTVVKF